VLACAGIFAAEVMRRISIAHAAPGRFPIFRSAAFRPGDRSVERIYRSPNRVIAALYDLSIFHFLPMHLLHSCPIERKNLTLHPLFRPRLYYLWRGSSLSSGRVVPSAQMQTYGVLLGARRWDLKSERLHALFASSARRHLINKRDSHDRR
jgi:hypothetical protein